jgi:hypothetical protein
MKLLLRLRMLAFTSSLRLGHSEFLLVLELVLMGIEVRRPTKHMKRLSATLPMKKSVELQLERYVLVR